jgi:hypothetical protein
MATGPISSKSSISRSAGVFLTFTFAGFGLQVQHRYFSNQFNSLCYIIDLAVKTVSHCHQELAGRGEKLQIRNPKSRRKIVFERLSITTTRISLSLLLPRLREIGRAVNSVKRNIKIVRNFSLDGAANHGIGAMAEFGGASHIFPEDARRLIQIFALDSILEIPFFAINFNFH